MRSLLTHKPVMVGLACVSVLFAAAVAASMKPSRASLVVLAREAVDKDAGKRKQAIEGLRQAGERGLRALVDAHPDSLRSLRGETFYVPTFAPEEPDRLRVALDQVAGQRDAFASELFWFTDREAALARAKERQRPVLSLRMLGRLDEELSCANSRLFRVLLYSDPAIAAVLKERFVLHWSSERAVPKVTIDLGDGRVLEETIGGNSIHYVLDAQGHVLDAMPGLVDAPTFREWLESAARLHQNLYGPSAGLCAQEPRLCRNAHHEESIRRLEQDFIATFGEPPPLTPMLEDLVPARPAPRKAVSAARALPVAVTKAVMEVPRLAMLPAGLHERIVEVGDDERDRLAAKRAERLRWPDAVRVVMDLKLPSATSGAEGPGKRETLERLKRSVALDTMVNRFELRPRILERLSKSNQVNQEELNTWVYDELFNTPATDPWLGLRGLGVFTALEQDGIAAP